MGQLILQGIPPYAKAYNIKFPGIYFLYALILTLFGQTHTGIHLALLISNTATIFLIYLLGKHLFDNLTGTVAGISYGIISLSPWYHGLWANSEHYVVFFAIAGILLFPSLALLSGIAIAALERKISSFLSQPITIGIVFLAIIIICSYPLFAQRKSLFQLTPTDVCRRIYGGNPFPESLEIARYLKIIHLQLIALRS